MSFLQLPIDARQRIYAYAGLQRPCPIDMLNERQHMRQRQPGTRCVAEELRKGIVIQGSGIDCHCPDIPIGILGVCRQMYGEASSILYGCNDLMVLGRRAADLNTIQRLSPISISHIRSLLIRLNCWPCPKGHDFHNYGVKRDRCMTCQSPLGDGDPELSLTREADRKTLDAWSATCSHLSEWLTPKLVHLSLIADVASQAEADKVICSFKKLPNLKQIDLRLARRKDLRLRNIAFDTVEDMLGRPKSQGTFPFERLPVELRVRILTFTDLTPSSFWEGYTNNHRLRVWGPTRGGRANGRPIHSNRGRSSVLPAPGRPRYRTHYHKEYHQTFHVSNNRIDKRGPRGSMCSACCQNCTLTAYSCCCHHYAAASAYCLCRLVPLDLFYVSKTMYADAVPIFYMQNRFNFHQSLALTRDFFAALNPGLSALFRHIVLKPFCMNPRDGTLASAMDEGNVFEDLISLLKKVLDIKKLSLTLDTRDYVIELYDDDEYLTELYETHCKAVRSMRTLNGLREFKFRSCREVWDADLQRQFFHGGEPRSVSELESRRKEVAMARLEREYLS